MHAYAVQSCTEMMRGMTSTANERQRLGQLVKTRRLSLGMSLTAAAKAADMHRNTWTGVEAADTETEDYNYAKIERVLGWEIGSCRTTLSGGEPAPVDEPEPVRPPQPPAQEILIEIAQDSGLPDHIRRFALSALETIRIAQDAAAAENERRYGHLRSLGGGA